MPQVRVSWFESFGHVGLRHVAEMSCNQMNTQMHLCVHHGYMWQWHPHLTHTHLTYTGAHPPTLGHTLPHWCTSSHPRTHPPRLGHTLPHWDTPSHTGEHPPTLGNTLPYWGTPSHTGEHSLTLGHTLPHWVSPSHSGTHPPTLNSHNNNVCRQCEVKTITWQHSSIELGLNTGI